MPLGGFRETRMAITVHISLRFMLMMLICLEEAYVHTVLNNAEALVVDGKEIGLEVIADETKYMVMSRDQNAGQKQNTKTDNSSFERVEPNNWEWPQIIFRKKLRAD
jgi:hypothetical protein